MTGCGSGSRLGFVNREPLGFDPPKTLGSGGRNRFDPRKTAGNQRFSAAIPVSKSLPGTTEPLPQTQDRTK